MYCQKLVTQKLSCSAKTLNSRPFTLYKNEDNNIKNKTLYLILNKLPFVNSSVSAKDPIKINTPPKNSMIDNVSPKKTYPSKKLNSELV